MNRKRIEEEVESVLSSYDDDPVLQGNPFVLARIKEARSKREHRNGKRFAAKLGLNFILTIIVLILNITTVIVYLEARTEKKLEKELLNNLKADFQIEETQSEQ